MPASANDTNVVRRFERLLSGTESLHDFADWFIDALWSIELNGSEHEIDLAGRLHNRLAGFSSGYVPVDELMADLREDAAEFGVELRESSAA